MSKHRSRLELAPVAAMHAAPPSALAAPAAVQVQRTFDLPVSLHAATVALYFAFVAIMGIAFRSPEMAIPIAICFVVLIGGFGVPWMWTRMQPANPAQRMRGSEARRHGIPVHTGRLTPGEAAGQVLVLPVLLVFWACAVAVIVALIR